MTKKSTFTCKVCGGEHKGLICEKFTADLPRKIKEMKLFVPVALLAAPITPKAVRKGNARKSKVTRPVTIAPVAPRRGGRVKVHGSKAEKQAAYRARKKQGEKA